MIYTQSMVIQHCYKCGIPFAMTEEFNDRRLKDHESWYCPAGHSQVYTGKSDEEKLKEQLAAKERELSTARADLYRAADDRDRAQRKLKRTMTRIHAGVCPHCNRSFTDIRRHMASKHGRKP